MEQGYQNLHTHTVASDGELGYEEVLDVCAENDISVVAFTDHDSLPDDEALKLLDRNRSHPTDWILGVEISSGWPKEIEGAASNFHIVGLFVDPKNKGLRDHCRRATKARRSRMGKMVENLQGLGFEITKEDCLEEAGKEVVGRPHIVSALKRRKKNRDLTESLLGKMKKEAERDRETREKYERIKNFPRQAPYLLFLSPDAFIEDVFVPYLYYKEMDQSVHLIREAGGVALLAHWTFCKHKVPASRIASFFEQDRLDGAEIVFGVDREKNFQQGTVKGDMKTMEGLTAEYEKLQSGGGDSHTEEDLKRFSRTESAEKTVGMVERMREKRKLNLRFSSLR